MGEFLKVQTRTNFLRLLEFWLRQNPIIVWPQFKVQLNLENRLTSSNISRHFNLSIITLQIYNAVESLYKRLLYNRNLPIVEKIFGPKNRKTLFFSLHTVEIFLQWKFFRSLEFYYRETRLYFYSLMNFVVF